MERLWSEIQEFNGGFAEAMDLIEKELLASLSHASPDALYDASRHLILTGGKKVRPALVALAYDAVGGKRGPEYILPIAIAAELIHTATIIHDDIIDRSSKRRGLETVFKKWGEEAAILAGDLLFSKAFGLVGVHEIKELTEVISETCIRLTEGEMLEFRHTRDTDMSEEVYLEIIERKTASLFEACTRCGALLGKGSEREIKALTRFGYYLGTSFQIVDDVLDITADDKFGKPKAIDIREGKVTIAALHALKQTKGKERTALESIIKKKRKNKKDMDMASEIIKKAGSIEYAFKKAEGFSLKAKEELKALPNSEAKSMLLNIAASVIHRPF